MNEVLTLLGAGGSDFGGEAGAGRFVPVFEVLWGNVGKVNFVGASWMFEIVWGKARPVWGKVRPVLGRVRPVWGKARPVWGRVRPVWGRVRQVWGKARPVLGNVKFVFGKAGTLGGARTAWVWLISGMLWGIAGAGEGVVMPMNFRWSISSGFAIVPILFRTTWVAVFEVAVKMTGRALYGVGCAIGCWYMGCWCTGCWYIGCWYIGCWYTGCGTFFAMRLPLRSRGVCEGVCEGVCRGCLP